MLLNSLANFSIFPRRVTSPQLDVTRGDVTKWGERCVRDMWGYVDVTYVDVTFWASLWNWFKFSILYTGSNS